MTNVVTVMNATVKIEIRAASANFLKMATSITGKLSPRVPQNQNAASILMLT